MSSSQDRSQNTRSGGDRNAGPSQDDNDSNHSPTSDIYRTNISSVPTPNSSRRRRSLQTNEQYNDNNISSQDQQRSPTTPISRASMSIRNTPIGSNRYVYCLFLVLCSIPKNSFFARAVDSFYQWIFYCFTLIKYLLIPNNHIINIFLLNFHQVIKESSHN